MSLSHIPLDQIVEGHLRGLIEERTPEGRSLDYKSLLSLKSDGDKREFAADVSAFANSDGGDLVFGVSEAEGLPISLEGLEGFIEDDTKLAMDDILKSTISPRLVGVTYRSINQTAGRPIFIVRVPRSWNGPHMVSYGGNQRFYSRDTARRYQMDVHQLRSAFLGNEQAANRVRDFRLDRCRQIASGLTPVRMTSRSCFAMHVVPLREWDGFEYAKVVSSQRVFFRPIPASIASGGWSPGINFEGAILAPGAWKNDETPTYLQVFRDGAVEAVCCGSISEGKIFPIFQLLVRDSIGNTRTVMSEIGISHPCVVFLSFLNVRGHSLATSTQNSKGIDRDHLFLEPRILESPSTPADPILRDWYDRIWNAFGYLRSDRFDEAGNWLIQRDDSYYTYR
jgi:hypothetical protein